MRLDLIMVFKVFTLVFILVTPVLDYKKMLYLNNIFVKLLILFFIVFASFKDMQLAILLMIALLIILINFNKIDIVRLNIPEPPEVSLYGGVFQEVVDFPSNQNSLKEKAINNHPKVSENQNIPKPSTFEDEDVSHGFPYDGKMIKSSIENFEQSHDFYIKLLSPDDSFEKIQSNTV